MKNTKKVKQKEEIKLPSKQLIPNSMQQAFISSLRNIRNSNESKALLISATGTGNICLCLCLTRPKFQESPIFSA